jgi:hypothetical protein
LLFCMSTIGAATTARNGTAPEDVFPHLQDASSSDIATAQAPVCREH